MSVTARFVPWVRPASWDGDAVTVRVAGQDVAVPVSRYGPGDVTGIAPDQIRRRDPAPGTRSMPPNLLASIEFTSPSMPWLMTPGGPDGSGALQPWLALVVVPGGAERLATVGGAACPVIEVAADRLPPPAQLAMWAHVQIDDTVADPTVALSTGIARILAPYALAPTTDYLACLVPTFEAARLAGLGKPVPDPRSAEPAWGATRSAATVTLPVYDSWAFATTDSGDLETLARRLTPRDLSASSRPLAIDAGAVTGELGGRVAPMLGALAPMGSTEAWDPGAASVAEQALAGELERAADAPAVGDPSGGPRVGLPVYGSTAAASADVSTGWSRQLNLDPRRRIAAALGAATVAEHQDALVDEAWRQAGDIDRAGRERQGALLADLAASRLHARMVAPLTAASALVTVAPALARMVAPGATTAMARVAASAVPPTMVGSAMRRILATKLPRDARRAGEGIRPAIARQNTRALFPGGPPPAPSGTMLASTVSGTLTTMAAAEPTAAAARELLPIDGVGAAVRHHVIAPPSLDWVPMTPSPDGAAPVGVAVGRAAGRLIGNTGIFVDGPIGPRTRPRWNEAVASWLDPSWMLAGVDLPPDTAGLLRVNAPFVEAVLVGANHELGRELRWRGVPVDPRATDLTQFFEAQGTTPPGGLSPVSQWAAADDLGSHVAFGEQVVLILRSHLVAHLDQTTIFLAPAEADGEFRRPSTSQVLPSFRGAAGLDTVYIGFPVDRATLTAGLGWYLVIQELVGAVRFGLDEATTTPVRSWNDLGWPSVQAPTGYIDTAVAPDPPAAPGSLTWGANAAHMAGIFLQRPVRLSIHLSLLLPADGA